MNTYILYLLKKFIHIFYSFFQTCSYLMLGFFLYNQRNKLKKKKSLVIIQKEKQRILKLTYTFYIQ